MKKVILDCDLMRFRNSGLYYYCLYLGTYVQRTLQQQDEADMGDYIPIAERDSFNKKNNIIEKKYHKFVKPFLWNCDVWHAPFQSGRMVPDKKIDRNVKILLTIHDLNSLHEGRSNEEQQKSLEHTQQLIDKSDAIVCISEFTRNDVLKNCKVGGRPVYVIYNGASNLVSSSLHSSSYKPTRPFLLGMGYVNQKKNYHVLLSLLKANEDIELLIAGRVDAHDIIRNMQQTAKEFGVEDRLRLLGPVTENEKSWYLSNCRAFVHPSKAEGVGLPVVEAMSFGKPVFISKLTSLPEIGGNAAFYFTSFDETHIQNAYHQGMRRYKNENMADVIKKRSQDFSWEKSAKDYIRVYQSLF